MARDKNQSDKQPTEAGLTDLEQTEKTEPDDSVTPETLVDEDEDCDPSEAYSGSPTPEDLREVREDEVGGGSGLDEEELARTDPLDGRPWDEDETED